MIRTLLKGFEISIPDLLYFTNLLRSLEEEEEEVPVTPTVENYIPYRDDPIPSPGAQTPGPDPPYSDGEAFQMQQQVMERKPSASAVDLLY